MNSRTTNFFEISVTPPIKQLYVTENYRNQRLDFSDNVHVPLTKDSIVSLYPFDTSKIVTPEPQQIEWLLKKLLFQAFERSKDFFDLDYRWAELTILDDRLSQRPEYSILRRLVFRVFHSRDKLLLAFDTFARIYNRSTLDILINSHGFTQEYFAMHNDCLVFIEREGQRKWVRGRIRQVGSIIKVEVPYLLDGTVELTPARIIPSLNKRAIAALLKQLRVNVDLDKEVKTLSAVSSSVKIQTILQVFEKYITRLFPLQVRDQKFAISISPLGGEIFPAQHIPSSDEPLYVVEREQSPQIKDTKRLAALSKVNITSQIQERRVVLLSTHSTIDVLERVISKLNDGITQGNYSFSLPSKFGIKLSVADRLVVSKYEDYSEQIDRLVHSPEEKHDALAILYLPLMSDLYYPLKAKLAHFGRVSQVVSTTSFDIYVAWNIGTNIAAKFGYIPWGISESPELPNADMVLGFAYSSLKSDGRIRRNIGHVNVFDRNGVWRFVQSSSDYLDFEKRLKVIPQMLKNAIVGFLASGGTPRMIDIHYSKRFSYQERLKAFEAIRAVAPSVKEVNFVSIDKTHPLRVFDQSSANLNLARGNIIELGPSEFLLSVAGEDRPNAPTSRLLKVRVWRAPISSDALDLKTIAYRILAMTKLNWRSAVRETTEPVTLKYSEEIARLTNHFSISEWNTVNNLLSKIPWFI